MQAQTSPPAGKAQPSGGEVVKGCLIMVGLAVVIIMVAISFFGGGSGKHSSAKSTVVPKSTEWFPQAVHTTQAALGANWPFRDGVTNGNVGCDLQHPGAIVFTPGDGPPGVQGVAIAINGIALDAGYPDIPKKIWQPDPAIGAYMSISPIHNLAPNGCEPLN
jgi:hypothetical protein